MKSLSLRIEDIILSKYIFSILILSGFAPLKFFALFFFTLFNFLEVYIARAINVSFLFFLSFLSILFYVLRFIFVSDITLGSKFWLEPFTFIVYIPLLLLLPFDSNVLSCANRLRSFVRRFISATTLLIAIDTIWRFFVNNFQFSLSSFTAIKYGIIFPTSNVSGAFCAFFIFLLVGLPRTTRFFLFERHFASISLATSFLLLILSFSRASYLFFLLIVFFAFLSSILSGLARHNISFLSLLVLSIFFFVVIFYFNPFKFIYSYILSDGSSLSKFSFLQNSFELLFSRSTYFLFGVPLSPALIAEAITPSGVSLSPHLPFLKVFLYYGLLGFLFWLYPWFSLLRLNSQIGIVFILCSSPIVFTGAPILWLPLIFLLLQLTSLKKLTPL